MARAAAPAAVLAAPGAAASSAGPHREKSRQSVAASATSSSSMTLGSAGATAASLPGSGSGGGPSASGMFPQERRAASMGAERRRTPSAVCMRRAQLSQKARRRSAEEDTPGAGSDPRRMRSARNGRGGARASIAECNRVASSTAARRSAGVAASPSLEAAAATGSNHGNAGWEVARVSRSRAWARRNAAAWSSLRSLSAAARHERAPCWIKAESSGHRSACRS
mmetsp:Transcript_11454/g.44352  ORF Transcript_11454/g.44352 Transcript_11454/m.44352 type:complete len:224 (+) Transcript_11454:1366-2037(+)